MSVVERIVFTNNRANFHFYVFDFLYNKKNVWYNRNVNEKTLFFLLYTKNKNK